MSLDYRQPLFANLPLLTSEAKQSNLQQLCLSILRVFSSDTFFRHFSDNPKPHILCNSQVTLNMRNKLITWLQKLALQTFHFSLQTYFYAVDLLDKYLARCLQSSSTLQLLGCACLFIASKNCEYSIVASECYVIASCNVFSKSDLFAMETKVVSELADDGIMQANFNILRLLRYVNWKLTIPSLKAHEFQNVLLQVVKHKCYGQNKNLDIVISLHALIINSTDDGLSNNELMPRLTDTLQAKQHY